MAPLDIPTHSPSDHTQEVGEMRYHTEFVVINLNLLVLSREWMGMGRGLLGLLLIVNIVIMDHSRKFPIRLAPVSKSQPHLLWWPFVNGVPFSPKTVTSPESPGPCWESHPPGPR